MSLMTRLVDDACIRLAKARERGFHTDVTFLFEMHAQEIHAHKLVLAISSPVFEVMLFGQGWTGDSGSPCQIKIEDIEPDIMSSVIEYLYTNHLPKYIPIQDCIKLLYTAKKYVIESLQTTLLRYLRDSITLDTVLTILESSILFDDVYLESKCWGCFDMDTDRVVLTGGFLSIDRSLLSKILERETLLISEIKLYEAVLRWADAECQRQNLPPTQDNLRSVVGDDAIRKIRFPSMDSKEFVNGPAISGLLSKDEINNTLMSKYLTVQSKTEIFSPKKRTPIKIIGSLICKCRGIFHCSFCEDRDPNVKASSEATRHSFVLSRTPTCYCCCRMRDYCPSRRIV